MDSATKRFELNYIMELFHPTKILLDCGEYSKR
jgi:hypothetical protein